MKHLKLFFACLLMAVLSIGQVWAAEQIAYTLEVASTGGNSSPHNSYTAAATTTIDGIEWSVTGNSSMAPWRLGGKGNNCSGVDRDVHSNTAISDNISKIEITHGTASSITVNSMTVIVSKNSDFSEPVSTLTPEFVASDVVTVNRPEGKDWSNCYYKFVYNLSVTGNSNRFVQFSGAVFYKEAGGMPTCSAPTFSPAAGAVASGTQVSISCSTEGAAIHYTTDGTDPTASSATYSAAIPVNSAMTIKAIAVKDGYDNSSIASAAYTVLTPLTTMDQIFDAATSASSTPTTVAITFNNWVVTGVKNSNAYVTDGTKGFIIYTSSHGFQVGDILSGTAVCKVQLYNGSAELTELTASKVTVNTEGSVSPVVLDAEGIAALTGANTGSVIKISGACTYENNKYYIAGVQLYNQLYSFSVSAGTNYECTGVYVLNTTYGNEILPRSAADIVAQTSVANPTFSPAAGEYTEVQNVTISCATDGATVYYTTDGTNPTNESTVYSSAIEVGSSMTIKAIAYKGEDHSEVVSAAYTINLPVDPETTCTWDLSAESYVADPEPTADLIQWTSTYVTMKAEKNGGNTGVNNYIPPTRTSTRFYTSNKITFIPANSKQITTIVITAASSGYATALKNATWTNATAAASDTEVTITASGSGNVSCVLGANTGITAVTVNYEPYVAPATYAVSFAAPEHGSLAIANGEDPIASGDEFVAGTELTVTAEPASGYLLDAIKVIETGSDPENDVTSTVLSGSTLTVPDYAITVSATFVENVAPDVNSYVLSEIGTETPQSITGLKVGDKVNLPLTATSCSKTFVGWDADENCATEPTYAPGAEYTLALDNKLYAVYADAGDAAWSVATSVKAGDVVVISTNTGYTANDMKTAGTISSSIFSATASTYGSENSQITELAEGTLQFTVGGNATDGWTLMNGTKYLKVTAAKKVNLVDDEETWTISFSGNNATLAPKTGDYTGYNVQYNYNSGNDRFTAYNTTQVAISLYKQVASYENYSTDCQAQVKTPTFSPAAGTYNAVQNVTISSETTGATIYYTTNGDVPTTSSTLYEGAIEVAESKTIKAIAVKDGMANSAVATAAYTINLPLSTMDQIFAAATAAGSTATDANIQFNNWVVSGVSTNGKNVFVTDGTKGFIIFDNGGEMGFAAGDVLSGTVACKVQLYKGAAELTTLSSATEGLNIATGGSVTPEVKAINALSGINTGAAVTINSVQFDGEYLTDGVNSIKPFNSLFAYDALENGKYYNVTGIYQQFDATKEILPRSAADIEEVNLEDPEISYTPASATIELGQSLPGTTFANPHELTISYNSNNEAVATVSNTGVIALGTEIGTAVITASFAGNATYAPANVTYTITVNPASVTENVVILAVYDTKYYAMSTTNASSAFTAIEVEYDGSQVTVNNAEDKAAIQWTKKTSGDNTTFQDANSKYMKSADGTSMSLQDAVCNWIWDESGFYKISGTTRTFFYQSGTGFKNFATSNFNKSGYSDKAQVIVIDPANIVITSKVSAELAYDPESDEITEGDAWSAPTLVNPHSVTITSYASDNESVATVEGGVIALAGGIGTANITAHFDGDASYLEGDAVYTITVNAVPEPADVCDGTDDFLDTEDKGSPTSYSNRSTPNGWTAVNAGYKVIDEKAYWMINGKTTAVGVITSPELTGGLGTLKFRYANTNSESNGVSVKIEIKQGDDVVKEYTLTKANSEVVQNTVYTETIENINVAGNFQIVITNLSPSNNTGNKDRVSIGRFCWTGYTAPEPPVVDYTEVRNGLTEGWYYTMCLDKAVTAVKAGSIWKVLSKAANGNDVILEEVTGTLDAGRPYIFLAAASTLEVAYTGDAVGAPVTEGNNGLVGSFTEEPLAQNSNHYIIYNNALYYVNSDNVKVGAHRAYLDMTGVPAYSNEPLQGNAPRRRVTMAVYGEQVATGFENLNASEKPVKLMIDGNIYILRGEKMYNVNGQVVK